MFYFKLSNNMNVNIRFIIIRSELMTLLSQNSLKIQYGLRKMTAWSAVSQGNGVGVGRDTVTNNGQYQDKHSEI